MKCPLVAMKMAADKAKPTIGHLASQMKLTACRNHLLTVCGLWNPFWTSKDSVWTGSEGKGGDRTEMSLRPRIIASVYCIRS